MLNYMDMLTANSWLYITFYDESNTETLVSVTQLGMRFHLRPQSHRLTYETPLIS